MVWFDDYHGMIIMKIIIEKKLNICKYWKEQRTLCLQTQFSTSCIPSHHTQISVFNCVKNCCRHWFKNVSYKATYIPYDMVFCSEEELFC